MVKNASEIVELSRTIDQPDNEPDLERAARDRFREIAGVDYPGHGSPHQELVELARMLDERIAPDRMRSTLRIMDRYRDIADAPYPGLGSRYQEDAAYFVCGADGAVVEASTVRRRGLKYWLEERAQSLAEDQTIEVWVRTWPWAIADGKPKLVPHATRGAKRPEGLDAKALAASAFERFDADQARDRSAGSPAPSP